MLKWINNIATLTKSSKISNVLPGVGPTDVVTMQQLTSSDYGYVPYTGAVDDVDLGTYGLTGTSIRSKTNLICDDYSYNEPQIIARVSGSTTDQAIFGKTSGDEYYLYVSQNVGYSFYANGLRTLTSTNRGRFSFTNRAASSGSAIGFDFQGDADTGLTAGADIQRFRVSSFTRQWLTGAIPLQRESLFTQPSYLAVAASTITFAGNLVSGGAPKAASNITITESAALYVETVTVSGGGSVGTSYGAYIKAQSGATTNIAMKVTGGAVVLSGAALATNATSGFTYVPSCAGVPSGVPETNTGTIPMVADSTNNKLYIYSGGSWVALN